MRAVDPRLLRHARAARGYLVVAVLLGLAVTGLILAQAALLAHALAAAARGTGAAALAGTLVLLSGVVVARGAAAYGGEAAALRAAAAVKSQLRRKLTGHSLRLGPAWLGGQQPGQIAALATRGLDGLDPYFARYLPQLVLSVLVPAAVLATVTAVDWISGVVIAVTLPLIPAVRGPGGPAHQGADPPPVAAAGPARPGTSSTWCRACPPSRCSAGPRPRSR